MSSSASVLCFLYCEGGLPLEPLFKPNDRRWRLNDSTGAATGQLAIFPTYSWVGNAYQGLVNQIFALPLDYAQTFAALSGSNNSANGTAVQQEWFPQLQSCLGAAIPCPREAVWDALKSLRSFMFGNCSNCGSLVFDKLGFDQRTFYRFVNREPLLFDGTRSNAPMKLLCGETAGFQGVLNWVFCPRGQDNSKISDYLASHKDSGALSQTPVVHGQGMMTFFNPAAICPAPASTPAGVLSQATLFHEALHGFYGIFDEFLQSDLGINPSLPTIYITYFLEDNILGGGASKCGN